MGLRSDGDVSVGVRIFDALHHTFILFPFTVFISGVCITTVLSDTQITVVSFHNLVLPWYIKESPTDGGELLSFTGSLLLNCPAMDAFLLAKISWVSSLVCTGEMFCKVVLKG